MEILLDRPPWFLIGPLLGVVVVAVFALLPRPAQLGQGLLWSTCTIAGIVAGILVHARRQRRTDPVSGRAVAAAGSARGR